MEEAADLVVRYRGSLSGEHGDGQARAELLPKMFGPEIVEAFREFKSIWDPQWKMNPGKVVDPNRLDQNLRVGPDYHPRPVQTYFKFPEDHGSFASATERCFGVGKCRGLDGGTMCPSFKATREEHIRDSLDLCLACKGCKSDCPVSVDMATYKAEFLAHYYEGRVRPRQAYAIGRIADWAHLASHAPGLANFMTHAPVLGNVAKFAAGISQKREVPSFAHQTFRSWFKDRNRTNGNHGAKRVLLWPDTFNNYFLPQTARAATAVLESAGCQVDIPGQVLCCGRPLYDYGMLTQAKQRLEETLEALGPEIDAGTPVVFLEPSCAAVFRDEMLGLLPDNDRAKRLSQQTFLFDEYLRKIDYHPPALDRRAIVHGHCHQKAVMGMKPTQELLSGMGVKAELLDSGCCGMAGSFGYESEHYDVSMKVGEHELLPKVRSAPKDQLIIASGFSCREQIEQSSDRKAVHLAEVLAMALPEETPARSIAKRDPIAWKRVAFAAAAAAVAVTAAVFIRRR